jgi:triosephosphate isomerase (TIM)
MSDRKRRRMIAGNWKMYKKQQETRVFFEAFLPLVADVTDADIVVAPPYTSLCIAVDLADTTNVGISAQNLDWRKEGAFT